MTQYAEAVERWRPLVEQYFPPALVDKALWVIQHESGGNPKALGDGGIASGLFQIQAREDWGRPSVEALQDPEANIRYAAETMGAAKGNWAAWGENNSYNGQPFGALGNNPYPGDSGGGADVADPSGGLTDAQKKILKDMGLLGDSGPTDHAPQIITGADGKRYYWDPDNPGVLNPVAGGGVGSKPPNYTFTKGPDGGTYAIDPENPGAPPIRVNLPGETGNPNDSNSDGYDDRTGLPNGVVPYSKSPTGLVYQGKPVNPDGSLYTGGDGAEEPKITNIGGNPYVWDPDSKSFVPAPITGGKYVAGIVGSGGNVGSVGGGGGGDISALARVLFAGMAGGGSNSYTGSGNGLSASDQARIDEAARARDFEATQRAADRAWQAKMQADSLAQQERQSMRQYGVSMDQIAQQAANDYASHVSDTDPAGFTAFLQAGGDQDASNWTIANSLALPGNTAITQEALTGPAKMLANARNARSAADAARTASGGGVAMYATGTPRRRGGLVPRYAQGIGGTFQPDPMRQQRALSGAVSQSGRAITMPENFDPFLSSPPPPAITSPAPTQEGIGFGAGAPPFTINPKPTTQTVTRAAPAPTPGRTTQPNAPFVIPGREIPGTAASTAADIPVDTATTPPLPKPLPSPLGTPSSKAYSVISIPDMGRVNTPGATKRVVVDEAGNMVWDPSIAEQTYNMDLRPRPMTDDELLKEFQNRQGHAEFDAGPMEWNAMGLTPQEWQQRKGMAEKLGIDVRDPNWNTPWAALGISFADWQKKGQPTADWIQAHPGGSIEDWMTDPQRDDAGHYDVSGEKYGYRGLGAMRLDTPADFASMFPDPYENPDRVVTDMKGRKWSLMFDKDRGARGEIRGTPFATYETPAPKKETPTTVTLGDGTKLTGGVKNPDGSVTFVAGGSTLILRPDGLLEDTVLHRTWNPRYMSMAGGTIVGPEGFGSTGPSTRGDPRKASGHIDPKTGRWVPDPGSFDADKYAQGTGGHPGGPAIVGDSMDAMPNPEMVKMPGQRAMMVDHPTYMPDMPRGTQVVPMRRDMRRMGGLQRRMMPNGAPMAIPGVAAYAGGTLGVGPTTDSITTDPLTRKFLQDRGVLPAPTPITPKVPPPAPPPMPPPSGGTSGGPGSGGPATVDWNSLLKEVYDTRTGSTYADLNPYDARWGLVAPTVRQRFLEGRKGHFGIPVEDQQAEIDRYSLNPLRNMYGIRQHAVGY